MKHAKHKGIGAGRQWIPVPVDAIEAVMTAPTTKRRLWATAYLVCWVVSFFSLLRGRPSTLRDLAAWSGSTTLSRASLGVGLILVINQPIFYCAHFNFKCLISIVFFYRIVCLFGLSLNRLKLHFLLRHTVRYRLH